MGIRKDLLKKVGAALGIGGTAMYLGNEGEGETFTSYPRDARYKRLLRGEEIPLPGLENYVYGKDKFGYGTYQKNKDTVGAFEGRNQRDHAAIWGKFIQPYNPEFGLEQFNTFMMAPLKDKEKILKQYSGDTDDALWRSEEWMRISDPRR